MAIRRNTRSCSRRRTGCAREGREGAGQKPRECGRRGGPGAFPLYLETRSSAPACLPYLSQPTAGQIQPIRCARQVLQGLGWTHTEPKALQRSKSDATNNKQTQHGQQQHLHERHYADRRRHRRPHANEGRRTTLFQILCSACPNDLRSRVTTTTTTVTTSTAQLHDNSYKKLSHIDKHKDLYTKDGRGRETRQSISQHPSTMSYQFHTPPRQTARPMAFVGSVAKGTPSKAPSTPIVTDSPGNWRHPRMEEITRRRATSVFTETNLKTLVYNGLALFLCVLVSYSSGTPFKQLRQLYVTISIGCVVVCLFFSADRAVLTLSSPPGTAASSP